MKEIIPTAVVSDACLRVSCPVRVAPPGIRPLNSAWIISGPVRPSQHFGSVDIFLEAIEAARASDVLVIDNQCRTDEACVGDLVTLEAKLASLQGIVIWGLNRDSAELLALDLPVFSYGSVPPGPARLDPRRPDALSRAQFGPFEVTAEDWVVGDSDGVLFFPQVHRSEVFEVAQQIWKTERSQASRAKTGESLRDQFRFREYLRKRESEPQYTFRTHLRKLSGSIEE
jgi:4-hydroxy-4-methyl-2-oxoglutarate aldolase